MVGHVAAERRFMAALKERRLHHAWLLTGPTGVGKATLAYRMARHVLAHGASLPDGVDDLFLPPDHPVFRRVAAGSHPDLRVLARREDPKTGRLRAAIGVDDVREMLHFAAMTAAEGGWRAIIIDAADDLNAAAANALLKTLEEPPPATLFLLVAHAPGRLLATIRSRCLQLALEPLDDSQVREALALVTEHADVDRELLDAIVPHAGGSPGRALALAATKAGRLFGELMDTLSAGPQADALRLHAIAQRLAPARMLADWQLFMDVLLDWLRDRAVDMARKGHGHEARAIAEAEAAIRGRLAQVEALNLDRGLFLTETFNHLRQLTLCPCFLEG